MKIIGLTGGIGAGKTAVSYYIAKKGFTVLDADEISREITASGTDAFFAVLRRFGAGIVYATGEIDRDELARLVFSDEKALADLNAILHGRIAARLREMIEEQRENGEECLFVCIPLLYETGMRELVDEVWLTDADEETRLRRILTRDNISEEQARARVAAQWPSSEKRKLAEVIIDNDETQDELFIRVDELLDEMCARVGIAYPLPRGSNVHFAGSGEEWFF